MHKNDLPYHKCGRHQADSALQCVPLVVMWKISAVYII